MPFPSIVTSFCNKWERVGVGGSWAPVGLRLGGVEREGNGRSAGRREVGIINLVARSLTRPPRL